MNDRRIVIEAVIAEMRKHKRYAESAFEQLRDEDFFFKLNSEQNSIYVYVKHLSGNMVSRFSDFLTSDGEKPTRDREREFVESIEPREQILAMWEKGWSVLLASVESLVDRDLETTVYIRREPHSVILALTRQLAHVAYHVGQIVLLAKHVKSSRGESWKYMTVPPGGSAAFNRSKGLAR